MNDDTWCNIFDYQVDTLQGRLQRQFDGFGHTEFKYWDMIHQIDLDIYQLINDYTRIKLLTTE